MIEELIKCNQELINPGSDESYSEAASIDDCGRQGDLYFAKVSMIPDNYIQESNPRTQLVPGNTKGSKHCLVSLDNVEVHLPIGFSFDKSYDSNLGPIVVLHTDNEITHCEHGNVKLPAGTYEFRYQNDWDIEEAKIRRQLD
jgi:hypothetical protein